MKYPRMVYVITNDGTGKKYVGSPQMDDMSKGYFLGYAEAMARQKEEKEEKKDESSAV